MGTGEQRIKAVSYTALKDFEQCPQRAYLKYALKSPQPEDPQSNAAANRGTLIHTEAENFITGKQATLPKELAKPESVKLLTAFRERYDAGQNIEVEQNWGFTSDWGVTGWFDNDIWLRVKCDVVAHENDDCDVWVVDHKSGKRFGNEVPHSQQGLSYAVAAAMRYPDAEAFKVTMHYTDEGKLVTKKHTRENIIKMAPSFDARFRAVTDATTFPAKPSKIACRFCPFRPVVSGGTGVCVWGVETP